MRGVVDDGSPQPAAAIRALQDVADATGVGDFQPAGHRFVQLLWRQFHGGQGPVESPGTEVEVHLQAVLRAVAGTQCRIKLLGL